MCAQRLRDESASPTRVNMFPLVSLQANQKAARGAALIEASPFFGHRISLPVDIAVVVYPLGFHPPRRP